MAKSKSASGLAALAEKLKDPKNRSLFAQLRDQWEALNERKNKASNNLRTHENEVKGAGFTVQQIKDALRLATPEGEAEFRQDIANMLSAAILIGHDLGEQLGLFYDEPVMSSTERAFEEGKTASIEGKALRTDYAPETPEYRAFEEGYHSVQDDRIRKGISRLDRAKGKTAARQAKEAAGKGGKKAGKGGKKAAPAAKPKGGKRGRPPKNAQRDAGPPPPAPKSAPTAGTPISRADVAAGGNVTHFQRKAASPQ